MAEKRERVEGRVEGEGSLAAAGIAVVQHYNRHQRLAAEGPQTEEEWTTYSKAYDAFQDAMDVLAETVGLETWSSP